MCWAGVLDLADVAEHGNPILVVEGWVACCHLKDQYTSCPPVAPLHQSQQQQKLCTAVSCTAVQAELLCDQVTSVSAHVMVYIHVAGSTSDSRRDSRTIGSTMESLVGNLMGSTMDSLMGDLMGSTGVEGTMGRTARGQKGQGYRADRGGGEGGEAHQSTGLA